MDDNCIQALLIYLSYNHKAVTVWWFVLSISVTSVILGTSRIELTANISENFFSIGVSGLNEHCE